MFVWWGVLLVLACLVVAVSHIVTPVDRPARALAAAEAPGPGNWGLICAAILFAWTGLHLFLWSRRDPDVAPPSSHRGLSWLLLAMWLAMLLAVPFTSTDVFLYLAHASTWMDFGNDPYGVAPIGNPGNPFLGLTPWPTDAAQYGPLGLAVSGWLYRPALGVWGNLTVFRIVAIASVGLAFWLAHGAARELGRNADAPLGLLVAASPLLLIEAGIAAHNDAWIAPLVLGAVYLLLRGRLGMAIVVFAASVWIKYTTVVLAPAIAVFIWRHADRRHRWMGIGIGVLVAAVSSMALLAPFGGLESPLRGLSAASARATRSMVWVAGTALEAAGGKGSVVVGLSRAATVLAAVALALRLKRREDLPQIVLATYVVFLLIGTAWFQPWYLIPLLPLSCIARNAATRGIIVGFSASAVLGLYGVYFVTYSFSPANQLLMTAVTFVPVLVMLGRHWREFFLVGPAT
jgi:hypothetical protein